MNKHINKKIIVAAFSIMSFLYAPAQLTLPINKLLQKEYNLAPVHSSDTQYFVLESKLLQYNVNGTRKSLNIYRLYLRCVPFVKTNPPEDEYTCTRFTVQLDSAREMDIPALANWKYLFTLYPDSNDKQRQLFGIDHSKFEHLTDDKGKVLPIENTFHVYNAFIDFHSMSVFAERTPKGRGVQDIKQIGQKIIHEAAFSQPGENLGSQVAEGSYFKNGEITLTFKGLSLANHKSCAMLGYDSGESSFYMVVKPFGNMEVKTKGSSHYFGDIYKDLKGGWIQKATLHELVISETIVPGQAKALNGIIERTIEINNIPKGKL